MAVWIGRHRFLKIRLCEEFGLIWTNQFRLLGIDFDSDLANMDRNFHSKIDDIKKLYNNWLYRQLTPIGRITIIKSLALSKLSHVILACPQVSPQSLAELEKLSFQFLWKNKPDRIKRCYITLPYEKGGLKMQDIQCFWNSLKVSWARRLLEEDCAWQKILQLNLLYENYDMNDVWYGGPTWLRKIASKLTNLFWKETLLAFALVIEEIPFAHPHFFFHLNIFNNPFFSNRGLELERGDFWMLWENRKTQVGDYFNCDNSPPTILSSQEFNTKFGVQIDFLRYHRIKSAIENAAKDLNYKIFNDNLSDVFSPKLPLIHKLSCLTVKGCSIFYTTLRAREVARRNTSEAEEKWHNELGTVFSIQFWDSIWKLSKTALVSNKMKWISLQINTFLPTTNYTVNKYNQNQNPGCSFCQNH